MDGRGRAVVVGDTNSHDFPTEKATQAHNAGRHDVFVSWLSASGARLLYSSYLGGRGDDFGQGITLDPGGNLYLTGFTFSADFPTLHPIQMGGSGDAILVKIRVGSPAGRARASHASGDGV